MTAPLPGTVYLTGAGPGDPDLLTVRASRLIATADAIFHDDLVPAGILQLCRPDALIVSVGKRCGVRSIGQEQINQLLVDTARAGHNVVRLKSGDPLLYGRAAEELAALEQEGIPCEVVPGVSALFAAAAGVRASLTDRRAVSKLIVLTAHRAAGSIVVPLWPGDLPLDATIAIYMPGSDYEHLAASLLDAALPRDTPCVVVSQAGTRQQQSLRTSLGKLADHGPLPAPSVVLVGRALGAPSQAIAEEILASAAAFAPENALS